jgi:hypothetical protein
VPPVSRASGVYRSGLGPSDNASNQEIQKAGHVRFAVLSLEQKSDWWAGQPRSYPLHCKRQPSAPCAHGRRGGLEVRVMCLVAQGSASLRARRLDNAVAELLRAVYVCCWLASAR